MCNLYVTHAKHVTNSSCAHKIRHEHSICGVTICTWNTSRTLYACISRGKVPHMCNVCRHEHETRHELSICAQKTPRTLYMGQMWGGLTPCVAYIDPSKITGSGTRWVFESSSWVSSWALPYCYQPGEGKRERESCVRASEQSRDRERECARKIEREMCVCVRERVSALNSREQAIEQVCERGSERARERESERARECVRQREREKARESESDCVREKERARDGHIPPTHESCCTARQQRAGIHGVWKSHFTLIQSWLSHVTHTHESRHEAKQPCAIVQSVWLSHVTNANESCHTSKQPCAIVRGVLISHVTHAYESSPSQRAMSRCQAAVHGRSKCVDKSCHTHDGVIALAYTHVQMSHVTQPSGRALVFMGSDRVMSHWCRYEWVMSLIHLRSIDCAPADTVWCLGKKMLWSPAAMTVHL